MATASVLGVAFPGGSAGGAGTAGGAALLLFGLAHRNQNHAGRWGAGAAGEQSTASALERARRQGDAVFHDLRLPGRRGNLDHLVVGPAGVIVIETKRWSGSVQTGPFGLRRDGGRDHRGALAQARTQVALVQDLMGQEVPVRAYLCITGACVRRRWWWPRTVVRGVATGGPDDLVHWLRRRRRRRRLGRASVRRLTEMVEATFVPSA